MFVAGIPENGSVAVVAVAVVVAVVVVHGLLGRCRKLGMVWKKLEWCREA